MRRSLLYGSAIVLALSVSAKAATIQYDFEKDIQWIKVTGEITTGDFEAFKRQAAKANGKVTVFFDSPGGNLIEALQIGEFIRLRGWFTLAARCFSACSLSWLSGSPPMMIAGESQIGFHAASVNGQERGTGNALIGAYMNRIGLGYDAIAWATTASPTDMSILTPEKAKELGIEVKVFSDKQANAQPAATAPTQPVTTPPVPAGRNCTLISVEVRYLFPTSFNDCREQPIANTYRLSFKYQTKKVWDRFIPSSGRYISRALAVCLSPECEDVPFAHNKYRLIAKDHDAGGSVAGGSVCYFDSRGWSDCENNLGKHYSLKAGSIDAFLAIAGGAEPVR